MSFDTKILMHGLPFSLPSPVPTTPGIDINLPVCLLRTSVIDSPADISPNPYRPVPLRAQRDNTEKDTAPAITGAVSGVGSLESHGRFV